MNNMSSKILVLSLSLIMLAVLYPIESIAIPAFARKNNLACSSCHTAYPALSVLGRQFKEAGYRFTDTNIGDMKISDNLIFDSIAPVSLAVISRPFADTKSGTKETRAIHEAEIFVGGEISKKVSGFVNLEAEGEDGFGSVLGSAQVTYTHNPAVNIQMGYGATLMADPYDTYADMRRLTASHYALLNQDANNDNGEPLRHSRQQVSLYGRVANKIFYNVGFGGLTGDLVGADSSIYFGRIAYDISPAMMIGTMALQGTCKTTNPVDPGVTDCSSRDLDFSRVAIDGQFDFENFRLTGVYASNSDDTSAGSSEDNKSSYLQGVYMIMQDGRPVIAPLLRLESYEENNGNDKFSVAIVNVAYYFTENVRGFLEYSDIYNTPTGTPTDNATTLQVEVVF